MYERGKGGELIPMGEIPEAALEAFARADEEAIFQHMAGLELDHYVYSFPIEGKDIMGIGWTGAREMARIRGHLEVIDFKADRQTEPIPDNPKEDEEVYYVGVRVRDNLTGVTFLGVGRQPKWKTLKDGTRKFDRAAFSISINKGQRNAFLYHIPEEAKQATIQRFIEQGKVKKLPPAYGGTPLAGQPESAAKTPDTKAAPAPAKKNLSPVPAKADPAKAAASPPVKSTVQELGYIDEAEQLALRKRLADLLTIKLAMTREQAIKFVNSDTTKLTKTELEARVKEAEGLLETYQASKAPEEPLL